MAKDPIVDKLISARVYMLMNLPFFGNLATRLKIIDASDWVPTAGTDGKHFYYNRDFVNKLDKKELVFLMGHEVLHCAYDHMSRRGSRDPQLWNCAADYVINYELVEHNVGKLIHHPGTCEPCYDQKYAGMSADQIYELLKEDQEKNKNKGQKHQFDVHMDPDPSGDGDAEEDPSGKSGPIPMTAEERAILKDEIKQATLEAAKTIVHTGKLPGGIKAMLKDLTEPQLNWRELLNAQVQSCVKNDYTFARPSRKNANGSNIILPGMLYDTMIEIAVAIDTSGSISDKMIRDFMSEVKGIMLQFQDFKLKVWCSDTKCYTVHDFTPDNADDIDTFEIEGRGGNDFECNWELMRELQYTPLQFIHFTDGWDCCGDRWKNSIEYCDTIFVIINNPGYTCDGIMVTHYEEHDKK